MKFLLPYDSIIRKAIEEMPYDKPFSVEDLFPPGVWGNISHDDRRNIGREFSQDDIYGEFPNIERITKNSIRNAKIETEPLDVEETGENYTDSGDYVSHPAKYIKYSKNLDDFMR